MMTRQADAAFTRLVNRAIFRDTVLPWSTPFDAARANSGPASFRAASAPFLSPAARASSTLRTELRTRLSLLLLTSARRSILRAAFLADDVLAILYTTDSDGKMRLTHRTPHELAVLIGARRRPVNCGGSAIPEGRRPLFGEGRHPFLLILGSKKGVEQPLFEAESLGKRRLEGAIDRFLGHHRRRQREPGDLLGGLHRLIEQASSGHHACDK